MSDTTLQRPRCKFCRRPADGYTRGTLTLCVDCVEAFDAGQRDGFVGGVRAAPMLAELGALSANVDEQLRLLRETEAGRAALAGDPLPLTCRRCRCAWDACYCMGGPRE